MSNPEEIKHQLQELTSFIEEAQNELRQGKVVNLSHLDNEVAQLCNQTLALPPEQAVQMQPIMGAMISKLEELSLSLKDFQNELKAKEVDT